MDALCREPSPGVNLMTASRTPFPGVALARGGQGEDKRNLSTGIPELSWFLLPILFLDFFFFLNISLAVD